MTNGSHSSICSSWAPPERQKDPYDNLLKTVCIFFFSCRLDLDLASISLRFVHASIERSPPSPDAKYFGKWPYDSASWLSDETIERFKQLIRIYDESSSLHFSVCACKFSKRSHASKILRIIARKGQDTIVRSCTVNRRIRFQSWWWSNCTSWDGFARRIFATTLAAKLDNPFDMFRFWKQELDDMISTTWTLHDMSANSQIAQHCTIRSRTHTSRNIARSVC